MHTSTHTLLDLAADIKTDALESIEALTRRPISCPAIAGSIDFLRGWLEADSATRAAATLGEVQDLVNAASWFADSEACAIGEYVKWRGVDNRHQLQGMMEELEAMRGAVKMWDRLETHAASVLEERADEPPTAPLSTPPTVPEVAAAFWSDVQFVSTHDALTRVDTLNEAEENPCIDHLADLIDANEYMLDALSRSYLDRGIVLEWDAENQEQADLWNAAWTLAKNTGYAKDIGELHDMCSALGLCPDYEVAYDAKMRGDALFFFALLHGASTSYTVRNIAQTWSDAEDLGWSNPLGDVTDDTDPAAIDAAERSALDFIAATGRRLVIDGE